MTRAERSAIIMQLVDFGRALKADLAEDKAAYEAIPDENINTPKTYALYRRLAVQTPSAISALNVARRELFTSLNAKREG